MSLVPHNLYYTESHEWLRIEDNLVTIGITDHAQNELGDLVYVQLPETGESFDAGDDMAVVESVKAASDLIAPLSGTVVETNDQLADSPQLINEEPYETWLVKLEIDPEIDLEDLLTPEQYEARI